MTTTFTTDEVAALYAVRRLTVAKWLRLGYIRGTRTGKTWAIDPASLASFTLPRAGRPRESKSKLRNSQP